MGNEGGNDEATSEQELSEGILKFTHTVERRMKPTLNAAIRRRDLVYEQMAELEQTQVALQTIEMAKEEATESPPQTQMDPGEKQVLLDMRVNIGEQFYMRAHVYEAEPLIVDVGFGVLVEMSSAEAADFFGKRRDFLQDVADRQSKQISEIRSQIEEIVSKFSQIKVHADADREESVPATP